MPSQQLAERVSHVTTRLARMLRQQDHGELTLTFRAALATIERRGPLTLGELAAIEHMAPPTVTKVVTQLGERGLVERVTDPGDRRVTRVSVSPSGAALLAADRKRRTEWLAGELRQLSADERERLAAAIDVLEGLTSKEMQRA